MTKYPLVQCFLLFNLIGTGLWVLIDGRYNIDRCKGLREDFEALLPT